MGLRERMQFAQCAHLLVDEFSSRALRGVS